MGFFSDLKDDLSQAVTELMPEDGAETTKKEPAERERRIVPEMRSNFAERERAASVNNYGNDFDTDLDEMLGNVDAEEESKIPEIPDEPEEPVFVAPPMEDKAVEMPMQHTSRRTSEEVSVLTESMLINGNVATEGGLEVRGSVVGNVEALGKLNITGMIQGNSQAAEIYAEGAKITGELRSNSSIKIGQSTVILGNIYANSAVIAGAIKGDIDVKGPVILDSSAIVMGDIKSKSVQINNGAVIEGMCSQCYADVNPTSFFDNLKNK